MEPRKKVVRFTIFRDEFLLLVSSPHFGEPKHHQQRKADVEESPAYRELQKTGLSLLLRDPTFLHGIHRELKEHARLEGEKPKVREVAHTARPIVVNYRYAQRRLERIKRDLVEFDSTYGKLFFEPQLNEHIHSALEHLDAFQWPITDRKKLWISRVHTKLRKQKDEQSNWDPLLKGYNYNLASLHSRAADQWLWRELSNYISQFKGKRGKHLSAMTRFKLISAICAASVGPVEPLTIKEYLRNNP
jgi:hypothetical protein